MEARGKISSAFGMAVLAFALSYGVISCLDPVNFPIRTITFIGEQSALSFDELQEKVIGEVEPGFIRLKVTDIQSSLLLLPWIKQVDIRRIWPNKLVIKYEEHVPVARWGENGIVSATGQVFFPKGELSQFNVLPYLKGPSARSAYVWQQYLAMKDILAPHELQISQLTLAPRGAWHLKLNNGMTVNLGTDDIIKRLKRFVRVYKTHLQSKHHAIAYVDLRYTSGLAVGWKSG